MAQRKGKVGSPTSSMEEEQVAGAVVVAGAAAAAGAAEAAAEAAAAAGAARTRATIAVKRATGPPIAAHLVAARTAHLLMSLVQYVGNHIKSPSVS